MPRELRSAIPIAFASLPLVLSACGSVDNPSPTASGPPADPSSSAITRASGSPSLGPTAEPSPQGTYVNEAYGWSIVVPDGWRLEANLEGNVMLSRPQVIAEVLASPASGLTLEQLEAQRLDELRGWPGMNAVESEIVRLPVGEAVRTVLEMTHPNGERAVLVTYAVEEGDHQYVISVRGPLNDEDLLDDAEAFAESFAVPDR